MSKGNSLKKKLNKFASICLAASMAIPSNVYADSVVNPSFKDGVYDGESYGYNSDVPIKLQVTVEGGKITKIDVISQSETKSYWERAKVLLDSIIEKQSTDVDVVSGATRSSNGIKRAVNDALDKAFDSGIFASGKGTKENPFVVSSKEQLSAFAKMVDEGESYTGVYIELANDIVLDGEWNPIGDEATNSQSIFDGHFDGKGNTISSINITGDYDKEANVGLFSTLGGSASVKNLNLTNVNIDVEGIGSVVRAGAIAGDTVNGSNPYGTLIDSVGVKGNVSVTTSGGKLTFAGGIAGRTGQYAMISNSWSDVSAYAISNDGTASAYAGGIAGMCGNNSIIVNDISFGDVTGIAPKNSNFGGMAGGIVAMFPGKMWNVVSTGDVKIGNAGSKHTWAGAIAGQITTSGMTKIDGEYVYPEQGALRKYGYYSDDIKISVDTYSQEGIVSDTKDVELSGVGFGTTTTDKVYVANAIEKDKVATENTINTLNSNLRDVSKIAAKYGVEDIKLNSWEIKDGRILPIGDVFVNTVPDEDIFEAGDGSKENPFIIKTENQLFDFAKSVKGSVDYEGYFVKLDSDIDVSDKNWVVVGGDSYAFNGTFDGNDKTITGLHLGSDEEAYALDKEHEMFALFGALESEAVVKNVNIDGLYVNATYDGSVYIGGIAAYMVGVSGADSRKGAVVDNCKVNGKIKAIGDKNNNFVAGVVAYQYKGVVSNCVANVDMDLEVKSGDGLAEVGGIVALNNRGLVANNYYQGDIIGNASRSNGDEGMAVLSLMVAVNAGDETNNVASGYMNAKTFSTYVGTVSGWVTGIGKCYNNYYSKDCTMDVDGKKVNPVESIGTKVPSGVSEDGLSYTGGVVADNETYDESKLSELVGVLNGNYNQFPIDISQYKLADDKAFSVWSVEDGKLVQTDERNAVTYVQPEAEKIPEKVLVMNDGTWYGRSEDGSVIATIKVSNGEVVENKYSDESKSAEVKEEALAKAKEKAVYGDTSNYEKYDANVYAGGDGTAENPYLVANEKQLRYMAESLNEDNAYEGVYFKQTADIEIKDGEWLPIGWGIMTEIKNSGTQYCVYPFLGNFDGDGFKITGLKIGSKEEATVDPRCSLAAGLFGVAIGENVTNDLPTEEMRLVNIKNVNLEDVVVNVKTKYQNYVGGLIGCIQNGFEIDNCEVSGFVSSYSADSHARVGGISSNPLRGLVKNTISNVDVYGESDAGNVYAGSYYGMDNRTTTVNGMATGSVTANAGSNNKIHAGGFVGMAGGAYYNTVSVGDVIAKKTTSDAGLYAGRYAGIVAGLKVYVNKDAAVKVVENEVTHNVVGVDVTSSEMSKEIENIEKSELNSEAFADVLNKNIDEIKNIGSLQDIVNENGTGLTHTITYTGDGSDLRRWEVKDVYVGFVEDKENEESKDNKDNKTDNKKDNEKTNDNKKSDSNTKKQNKDNEVKDNLKVGDTFTIKGYKYKITKLSGKNGEVSLVKAKKSKTVIIRNVVKYKNVKFKVSAIGKNSFNKKTRKIIIKTKNLKNIANGAFKKLSKKCVITLPKKFKTKIKRKYKKLIKKSGFKGKIKA